VAGFIGSSNFLEAKVVGHDPATGRATVETTAGLRLGGVVTDPEARPATQDRVTVAIRPERFRLGPADEMDPDPAPGWAQVSGRVTQGTYLGDQTEYRVEAAGLGELVIRRQNETQADARSERTFGPGEAVTVSWHETADLILAS
jgi:ABC-type Fe3+/spermidine/putrescine transport system ATPase subunit